MAERKNIEFDRPGGYAMPKGATQVQRRAAKDLPQADIRLLGDSVGKYEPRPLPDLAPDYQATDPETRLYVGDCRDVLAALPERGQVDLIFADPPFNWDVPYDQWHDGMPRAEYERFTFDWLDACIAALSPRGSLWVNIPDDTAAEAVVHLKRRGLVMINWCIWHFRFGQNRESSFIMSKVHVLYFVKDPADRTWNPEEILEPSDRASIYFDPRTMAKDEHKGRRVPMDVWYGRYWGRIQGNNKERRHQHHNQIPEIYLERVIRACSNPGDLVLDPFLGCYDERTTVLTRCGWKKFAEVSNTDEFLTRSPEGLLEYQRPLAIQRYKHRGDMVRIRSRSTDLLVTRNHNMLVQTHADFLNKRPAQFLPAEELTHRLYRIPCGGIYHPEGHELSRAEMYLIGLFVSEGYIQEYDGKRPEIRICQNRGESWNQIFDWLDPLDPRPRGMRRIAVTMPEAFVWWLAATCGRSKYNKRLCPEILCNVHLDALFDGMVLGDGHRRQSHSGGSEVIHYYTVSPTLAGDFQELCVKLGYNSTAHCRVRNYKQPPMLRGRPVIATCPCYDVGVRIAKTQKVLPQQHVTVEPYDGEVFCVTVPNHTLFVRRNGRTAWCGNSGTTCTVARALGRRSIGVEYSPANAQSAWERITQVGMIRREDAIDPSSALFPPRRRRTARTIDSDPTLL